MVEHKEIKMLQEEIQTLHEELIIAVGEVLDSDDPKVVNPAIVDLLLFERKHRLKPHNPHWANDRELNFEADCRDPEYIAWLDKQAEMFLPQH